MEDLKAYKDAPEEVKAILDSFDFEGDAYKECDRLLHELEPHGYTFDYGLDGEPYNLYKLNKDKMEYRILTLKDGTYIQIKFDVEGVVYDHFNAKDELIEEFGYDFYNDIDNITHLLKH